MLGRGLLDPVSPLCPPRGAEPEERKPGLVGSGKGRLAGLKGNEGCGPIKPRVLGGGGDPVPLRWSDALAL